jgi:hypothetical protein
MLRGVGLVRRRRSAARLDAWVVSAVISDVEELEKVGSVSADRCRQSVDRSREVIRGGGAGQQGAVLLRFDLLGCSGIGSAIGLPGDLP